MRFRCEITQLAVLCYDRPHKTMGELQEEVS